MKNKQLISSGQTSVSDNFDVTLNRYGSYQAGNLIEVNLTKLAAQNIRNSLINDLIEAKRNCKNSSLEEQDPICQAIK